MKKEKGNLRLMSLLAILALVLLMAVASTFSWYNRTQSADAEARILDYKQTGKVNSVGSAEVATFEGTLDNGIVSYSDTALASDAAVTAKSGQVNYFKTVITDTANSSSLVSLYLNNITCTSDMGSSLHIGIVEPEKTYKQFTGTVTGESFIVDTLCVEDDLILESGSTVEVYWFVEIDADYTSEGTINLGTQYLVYN